MAMNNQATGAREARSVRMDRRWSTDEPRMDRSRVAWTDPRYPARRSITSPPFWAPAARRSAHSHATRSSIDCPSSWVPSSAGSDGEAPRRQTVDLVEVVQEAVDSVRLETESWAAVVVSSGRSWPTSTRRQLRTAVVNLVRNAIAYSGKAEPVVVSVARRRKSATIVVHDRGPGPDPQIGSGSSSRSFRGSNAPGTPWGSGLGLYPHAARRRRDMGARCMRARQMEDPRSESRCLGDGGRQASAS
jgi:anti-sigma regulatory factor (Ser/Thr protein kinase)